MKLPWVVWVGGQGVLGCSCYAPMRHVCARDVCVHVSIYMHVYMCRQESEVSTHSVY